MPKCQNTGAFFDASDNAMKTKKRRNKKVEFEEKLSEERTLLSNERTFLSYIRTAFAVIVAGIAMIGLFKQGTFSIIGMVLVFAGVVLSVLGIVYYFVRKSKIKKGLEIFER